MKLLSNHGLLVLLLVLIGTFSLLRPSTFRTWVDLQAITSTRAVVALLALAVMVPLAANEYESPTFLGHLFGGLEWILSEEK